MIKLDHAEQVKALVEFNTGYNGDYYSNKTKLSSVDEELPKFLIIPIPKRFNSDNVQYSEFFEILCQADSLTNLETMIEDILGIEKKYNPGGNLIEAVTGNDEDDVDFNTGSWDRYNHPACDFNAVKSGGGQGIGSTGLGAYKNDTTGFLTRFQITSTIAAAAKAFVRNPTLGTFVVTYAIECKTNGSNTEQFRLAGWLLTDFLTAPEDLPFSGIGSDVIVPTIDIVSDNRVFVAGTVYTYTVTDMIEEFFTLTDFNWNYLTLVGLNYLNDDNTLSFYSNDDDDNLDPTLTFTFTITAPLPFFVKFKTIDKPYNANKFKALIECEARWTI